MRLPYTGKFRITAGFGIRYRIKNILSTHKGVDFAMPTGTSILASAKGTVTKVGRSTLSGNYIWIKHSSSHETFYCHLKSSLVKVGQKVIEGQKIAISDNTGSFTTGAHLHFALKVGGVYANPLNHIPNWEKGVL